jgi:glycosyltransferase involved in cell wall biosynthesis
MELSKSLAEKINLFIAPSKYLMDRFINDFNIPAGKIVYLDYGFPVHYLEPVKPDKKDVFTFGYIGTHIPAKGINLLIDAFSRFNTPAKLKIFGRTNGQSTTALKNMAQKCKNPVEFCGEYLNEDLATHVFNTVDAIVVPSVWGENSPLVIHEAQSCQVPVITANFGGMKEYVEHGVNGLLFEHRNAESLYQQMRYALENPQEMIELGKAGYLLSNDNQVQTIGEHCMQLGKFYDQIIQNNGKTF